MKQTSALIIMSLFAVSLIGQTAISTTHGFESQTKLKRTKHFESLKSDGLCMLNQRIKNQAKSPDLSKSTPVTKHRLDSLIYETYNESAGQWVYYSNDKYTYNENGHLILHFRDSWNESGSKWSKGNKDEYTYNSDGSLVLEINYDWDESGNQWSNDDKYEYTYDDNGILTLKINYNWYKSSNQWVPDHQHEYTYDDSGNLTLRIDSDWDESANQWVNEDKYEYTYDSNGNLILIINYEWDEFSNQWVLNSKGEYSYNDDDNLTLGIFSYWNESANQLIYGDKAEYTYDDNGNRTEFLYFFWDETSGQWDEFWKEVYTYNDLITYDKLILPFYFDTELFNHMLLTLFRYKWDENASVWTDYFRSNCYYSEQEISSIFNGSDAVMNIYPNPAKEYIIVDINNNPEPVLINLYDMQGKVVISQEVYDNQSLSVSHLSRGLYLYNFVINSKMHKGKIIIE